MLVLEAEAARRFVRLLLRLQELLLVVKGRHLLVERALRLGLDLELILSREMREMMRMEIRARLRVGRHRLRVLPQALVVARLVAENWLLERDDMRSHETMLSLLGFEVFIIGHTLWSILEVYPRL